MKALVTGDAGMVGRHYVRFLKELGWEVYGLDIKNDPDEDAFKFFVEETRESFDLLVHCAYEVGGRAHIDGHNMALANNVAMDAAMFNWALRNRVGAVLYFSSSAAYPAWLQSREAQSAFDEFDPITLYEDMISDQSTAPDANYGWAKLTGERIGIQASGQGLRVHTFRPFSGYSPDQDCTYPFPAIVKRAIAGDLTVWGPEGQTRDWIHIDDVVKGSFAVYQNDDRRPINLCTGIGTEFGELMKLARRLTPRTIPDIMAEKPEVNYDLDKPTGVFYRVGDPTRMNEHYVAKISIEEGVRDAITNEL